MAERCSVTKVSRSTGPPGDAAQDASVLLERHLEVAILDPAGTVDHLDAAGTKDRPRIAGPERRQRRHLRRDLFADRSERQGAVDPDPGPEIVRVQALFRVVVHARPQLANAARLDREAGRLLVAAELDHRVPARLERSQHVEGRNAAARSVGDVAIDRDHDCRPMKRVHELGRDDPDDPAVPAFTRHDDDRARSHFEIRLDQLARLRDDVGFFLLAPEILRVELLGQLASFVAIASSEARRSRAAMSGVLIRPAALTRGASTKPM